MDVGEPAAEDRGRGDQTPGLQLTTYSWFVRCKIIIAPLQPLKLFSNPMYRMQNQLQQFPQRAKKAPLDEDVTMEMEPNPFIQVRV